MTAVVLGIDLGGTGSRFVAVEPTSGAVLARRTAPTPHTGGPGTVRAFLREHLGAVGQGLRPVAVGVGASGPIDPHGVIRNPDTLPAFTGLPITAMLAALVPGPVVIDNDAVCAALAERATGAAQQSPRSLHITLGTGVGVCLLTGSTPFRLPDGTHPEGGHLAVALPTEPCYCGRTACWEQAASRSTLQRTAARVLGRSGTDERVIADLADLATHGDHLALATFREHGTRIAAGLATLLSLYGPDLVVLGGSAARYLPLFRPGIHSALDALGDWGPEPEIVRTRLDDYGGALGGAHLAATVWKAS
ncbi:ROK family protein [Crossiella cryophila]|uniref:Glucokinase n=1 Tax=Crossiella cryophila TaxID=43355 RepID=A0A7W7CCX2_9PSEU|nr:ROK family protein [Crossiella cryophila]MBB4678722.1 glucokinase [Crossiella cryophila]